MKNARIFVLPLLILFMACQDQDRPQVDPPKRLLTSIFNGDIGRPFTIKYLDGRVDSLLFNDLGTRYKVNYEAGRISSIREFVVISPRDTLRYHDFLFSYQDFSVTITKNEPVGVAHSREYTYTFFLGETGSQVTAIEVTVTETRDTLESLLADVRHQFEWDGENIIEAKIFRRQIGVPGGGLNLYRTTTYTYDENPNPYFGLFWPFAPNLIDFPTNLSANNALSKKEVLHDNGDELQLTAYGYTYGKKDFPEQVEITESVASRPYVFEFEYQ
jgi:hypothetical protein